MTTLKLPFRAGLRPAPKVCPTRRVGRPVRFLTQAAALIATLGVSVAEARHVPRAGIPAPTRVYNGAWFDIRPPSTFSARPSLKGISGGGYDSAFFESPDKRVEFYVFSPQWNGTPSDIVLDPAREVEVSRKVEEIQGMETVDRPSRKGDPASGSTEKQKVVKSRATWVTVRAKNGSYTRSWVDVENPEYNTRKVFGIRYRDARSLAVYKKQYVAFKASLRQFSD